MDKERQIGIWLEVSEVRFDTSDGKCYVQLKADKADLQPSWWLVEDTAAASTGINGAYGTYKAILSEMDKKRVALAHLTCGVRAEAAEGQHGKHGLYCNAFRFQSPDVGSR
jgi:hypothetical protein